MLEILHHIIAQSGLIEMTKDDKPLVVYRLKPTIYATRDTRKRIVEHGPFFVQLTDPNDSKLNTKPGWTMYQSVNKVWWGWFPNGEFFAIPIAQ
jgi:hypothetical protein